MDKFTSESSIAGVFAFHSSHPRWFKICWIFIFFLAFCGLGFYAFDIYSKCKLNPIISEKIGEIRTQEIPFPAVTICNPLFAKNQSVKDFLKNPGNLSVTVQKC